MANGTLKVSNIETSSGSGTITIGQSGETVTIASGATQTGIGGANTPAFEATVASSNADITQSTWTKLSFNSEVFDTDSAYDHTTNYRFTVPTGKAGKYFFEGSVYGYSGDNNLNRLHIRLYKNGSQIVVFAENDWTNQAYRNAQMYSSSAVIDLAVNDYIELYANLYSSGGTPTLDSSTATRLTGYKIIE